MSKVFYIYDAFPVLSSTKATSGYRSTLKASAVFQIAVLVVIDNLIRFDIGIFAAVQITIRS